MYTFPATLLFFLPIFGVIIVDLKFDLNPEKILTIAYYVGQIKSPFPGSVFIDALIVGVGITFLMSLTRNMNLSNLISGILLIALAFTFVFKLIPP